MSFTCEHISWQRVVNLITHTSLMRFCLSICREMVPALDVIRSRVAVARVKEGSGGKHRHHRQHRHSHLGYQSSESGYSAMSAPPAPKGSQVLLELGPDSASPPKHGPGK